MSSEFGESDPSRGFLRGAHWELVPAGPPLFSMASCRARATCRSADGWGANFHRIAREIVGHTSTWAIAAEDLPDESNRVTLDPELTDSSGIPAPRIRYRRLRDVGREPGLEREPGA